MSNNEFKEFTLADAFSQHSASCRKAAFTLAEVLITLGIIGVVAAMTMPTLIANHQKKVTVSRLKKAYSEISQAIKLAQVEHGTMETWNFSDFETPAERTTYFSENYLFPYIKTVKTCLTANIHDCFAQETYSLDGRPDGMIPHNSTKHAAFISASGYSVYYWIHGEGSGGWFFIDVNGLQKPNALGKDIFPFLLNWSRGFFLPRGMSENSNITREEIIDSGTEDYPQSGCKKYGNSRNSGAYCGSLIMYDGWSIEKDYPW